MKIISKFLCVLLLPVIFLTGCNGDGTFRQNISLNNNKVSSSEIEDIIDNNIYDYDVENDFSMTSASQAQADNPINDPDPEYYANKYVYNFLGQDTLPIGGYIEPEYTMLQISLEQAMREFVESGCNIMVQVGQRTHATSERKHEMMKYLEQYGGMWLSKYSAVMNQTGTIESGADKLYEDLKADAKYKSFAGAHVIDEPGWKSWTEGTMGMGHEVWNTVFNSKLFFVNLLPIYSPGWSFPNGATGALAGSSSLDYDYYYRSYIENVKPKVFCYDYYPLKGTFPTLKDEHFLQLYKSRYYAEDYNAQVNGGEYIPFWAFIQISGWSATRAATYAEVAWQINTAVVCGAKGLQYYIYNVSGNDISANAANPGTPVTIEGYKNSAYWDMQRANAYVQAMAKWFLNAKVDHIGQVGFTPNGEIIPEDMFVSRDPDFQWRLQNSGGVPHLVSYMKYYANNNNYDEFVDGDVQELYYVCNNSIVSGGDITLNFGEEIVSGSYIVGGKEFEFEGSSLTVNTGAGEAFALLLDK